MGCPWPPVIFGLICLGAIAWRLYDTYGFPLDLTQLMAEEAQLTIDIAGYEKAKEISQVRTCMHGTCACTYVHVCSSYRWYANICGVSNCDHLRMTKSGILWALIIVGWSLNHFQSKFESGHLLCFGDPMNAFF